MDKQEMQSNMQNNIQMGIIIVLLIIIAVMGFFLGKTTNTVTGNTNTTVVDSSTKNTDLVTTMTVIDDKRCTDCQTEAIIAQLKQVPSLTNVEISTKDFSDEGVSDYLKENNITALPAIIFPSNNVDAQLNQYLTVLPKGEYSLQLGAKFNPFAKRSENGFLLLDKAALESIKLNSYIKGNKDAKITWLEYSDLECPYCAKLHNSGTPEELEEKYGDNLNRVFNHFPLGFHKNAQPAAEILECLAEEKGADAFYSLLKTSYTEKNSTKSFLIDEAVKLGASESNINKCLDESRYTDKVNNEMTVGAESFGVTGTPGNVLINNETGEYEVISGAYPTEAFESIIDKLLK